MLNKYTLVTVNNYHELIPQYISSNNCDINNYEDMKKTIMSMISEGYCFNMDKNLLRGYIEDFTYMFSNNDENYRRVAYILEEEEFDNDEYSDENSSYDNPDLGEMVQNPFLKNLMDNLIGQNLNNDCNEEHDKLDDENNQNTNSSNELDFSENLLVD